MSNNRKVKRFTIDEFREMYSDNNRCLDRLFKLLYGDLKSCPSCSGAPAFKRLKDRRSYQCSHCGYQIYPTAGTVFDKTTTPLNSWFYAIYLQTVTRNGVAAKELERQLDICYKTALRMSHQIKKLMSLTLEKFKGEVQLDETFIGGQHRFKHTKERKRLNELGTGYVNKTPVFSILHKESKQVYSQVVDGVSGKVLKPIIYDKVETDSTIVSDNFGAYAGLAEKYKHYIVKHESNEYVKDNRHTNDIEGFFSIVKRTIKGTHIHVSDKHLQKYINEVAFRYYYRDRQDVMFDAVLKNVKRLSA